jgi:hypothetical protein
MRSGSAIHTKLGDAVIFATILLSTDVLATGLPSLCLDTIIDGTQMGVRVHFNLSKPPQ